MGRWRIDWRRDLTIVSILNVDNFRANILQNTYILIRIHITCLSNIDPTTISVIKMQIRIVLVY